ncbi:MAG: DUF3168 domain-containing protein [Pelagimonas sp.]|jgi:hypothetical protein|nr:DUF3168 domain-containing protein [Pelagimonas sp.]
MSYAVSSALQAAIYAQLQADGALSLLVGDSIFDAPPVGTLPPLYVSLGPEAVREAGTGGCDGAWHSFTVSVVTENAGFQTAKDAAVAVSDALHDADLTLSRGHLVGLWFSKARAYRETDDLRRVDLTFRARVEDE